MLKARNRLPGIAVFGLLLLSLISEELGAQTTSSEAARLYRVTVRYSIRAPVSQRVAQFRVLTGYLSSIGFVKDQGPATEAEDSDEVYMTGIISATNAAKILTAPYVHAILLVPQDFTLPSGDQLVKIQLTLTRVATVPRQRLLADQVLGFLAAHGFTESIGYDNRSHTRILGTIPARNLLEPLEDLRWQGTGWLVPEIPVRQLPEPIKSIWPLKIVEALPETGVPLPVPLAPAIAPGTREPGFDKITSGLRARISETGPQRLEVVVAGTPTAELPAWTRSLQSLLPGATLEGQAGEVLTLHSPPSLAPALARLPEVVAIRLPRPADNELQPQGALSTGNQELLQKTGLARLHERGARGQGVRLAIVDTDFRGYERLLGKELPPHVEVLDLTAECSPTLEPMPFSSRAAIGHGTQCAAAAMLAAPQTQLILIRVDPEAPFQILQIAHYLQGEAFTVGCLDERSRELLADGRRLEQTQEQLLEERREIMESFGQDAETVKRREAHFKKQAELSRQLKELAERQERYFKLLDDLQKLKNVQVIVSSLIWSDGYAVNGDSGLSRHFDDDPLCRALWLQSAGNTRGQAWSGFFHDKDGNGVMEFAGPESKPLPDRWTTELNFLGWRRAGSTRSQDLPQGRLRVSVQWSEPREPGLRPDAYQQSLANLHLLVLRQRDPSGTNLPVDDLELIAASSGVPECLRLSPTMGIYRQSVDFSVTQKGRYAIRLEGRIPPSLEPATFMPLPGQAARWELWPRLFVEARGDLPPEAGRPIFFDYATDLGNPGMPADAHHVASVGSATIEGQRQPYSSAGPPAGQRLYTKPDLLSFDQLRLALDGLAESRGSGVAASFAAGAASTLLSAGTPLESLRLRLFTKPGQIWP
jgi:hypothetical protein